jgi:hypothetical protein
VLAETEHHCVNHFLEWLVRVTPCRFARIYAAESPETNESRIACGVVLDRFSAEDVEDTDRLFDVAAERKMFGALLFPRVRYADELAEVLAVLHASKRWQCTRENWREKLQRPADVPIGLYWVTPAGERSSVMGFAPLGSMPVTRRAPYFALVAWPGGRDNAYAKPVDGVGFIDADPGVPQASYDEMKKRTIADTRTLLGDPPDDSILLRSVAFCLPTSVAAPFLTAHGL